MDRPKVKFATTGGHDSNSLVTLKLGSQIFCNSRNKSLKMRVSIDIYRVDCFFYFKKPTVSYKVNNDPLMMAKFL